MADGECITHITRTDKRGTQSTVLSCTVRQHHLPAMRPAAAAAVPFSIFVLSVFFVAVASAFKSKNTVEAMAALRMMPTKRLNNGAQIPLLGLGTWQSGSDEVKEAVVTAIRAGYRHIDCAHIYGNEGPVGAAIAECLAAGICTRDELFVTSKLWNDCHAESEVLPALQRTLEQLQLDYLDMYLSE